MEVKEHTVEMTHEELHGLLWETAGAASVPFMEDHPKYVMPTDRIGAGIDGILDEYGIPWVAGYHRGEHGGASRRPATAAPR